jgi:DNA-binding Xre family transcriptional regulator
MARKFKELRDAMSPEHRERAAARALELMECMDLTELRSIREVTQEDLAGRLGVAQSNVSRAERREDMRVSTLRDVVEALGGELDLLARFPDGVVRIRL